MILHTVNKAPDNNCLSSCLRVAAKDDAILLIEDGVYAAVINTAKVPDELFRHKVYALEADIKARGLNGKIAAEAELVDYQGFVTLVEKFDTVQSWY